MGVGILGGGGIQEARAPQPFSYMLHLVWRTHTLSCILRVSYLSGREARASFYLPRRRNKLPSFAYICIDTDSSRDARERAVTSYVRMRACEQNKYE